VGLAGITHRRISWRLYSDGKGRHNDEYKDLWNRLVPASGQADTVQGEVVRAIGRLASECYRNGNINWDAGFEMFVDFLKAQICDATVFDPDTLDSLSEDFEMIRDTGRSEPDMNYEDGEDVYDRVVEWCRDYPTPIALRKDPDQKR